MFNQGQRLGGLSRLIIGPPDPKYATSSISYGNRLTADGIKDNAGAAGCREHGGRSSYVAHQSTGRVRRGVTVFNHGDGNGRRRLSQF